MCFTLIYLCNLYFSFDSLHFLLCTLEHTPWATGIICLEPGDRLTVTRCWYRWSGLKCQYFALKATAGRSGCGCGRGGGCGAGGGEWAEGCGCPRTATCPVAAAVAASLLVEGVNRKSMAVQMEGMMYAVVVCQVEKLCTSTSASGSETVSHLRPRYCVPLAGDVIGICGMASTVSARFGMDPAIVYSLSLSSAMINCTCRHRWAEGRTAQWHVPGSIPPLIRPPDRQFVGRNASRQSARVASAFGQRGCVPCSRSVCGVNDNEPSLNTRCENGHKVRRLQFRRKCLTEMNGYQCILHGARKKWFKNRLKICILKQFYSYLKFSLRKRPFVLHFWRLCFSNLNKIN